MRFGSARERRACSAPGRARSVLPPTRQIKRHTFMPWRTPQNGDTLSLTLNLAQEVALMTAIQLPEVLARVEALERMLASLSAAQAPPRRRRATGLAAFTVAGVIAGMTLTLTAAVVSGASAQSG